MKITALVLLTLAIATTGLTAAAATPGFQDRRAGLASQINQIIGPGTRERIEPVVNDAQIRIIGAVRAAGARQPSPLQILTFGQKMALRRARRAHTEPDIDLTPEQRTEISAYIAAVGVAVAPVVRDEGAKIDLLLTPQQRDAIDALRRSAQDAIHTIPPAAGLPDLADAFLDAGYAGNGSFVLLLEIDPKAVAGALR